MSREQQPQAPDFSLDVTSAVLKPTIYYNEPSLDRLISVRLVGQQLPQTLAQIDRLWSALGGSGPIERFFLDQHLQELYSQVQREDEILAIFSLLTLVVAALGLLGLAAAAAERTTMEIGIRKAMGAGSAEMLQLLLWRFMRPVVWGSLAAWPLAALLMRHWLQGFVYHVDLQPWLFAAASAGVLLLSAATVSLHVWRFARAHPADALRYE